jgi:simple sugar transport system permease protein
MKKRILWGLAAPASALVFTVLVASIALWVSGNSPATTFRLMWTSSDSARNVVAILNRSIAYYIAGLAVALGFKMGLFNIGADGQYRLGIVVAAAAGAELSLPSVFHVAAIIIVAIAVAMAWAAIPAMLKVTRGVNEVISTIMLNAVATGVSAYLLANYFTVKGQQITQTKPLSRSAWIPPLNRFIRLFGYHFPKNVYLNGFLVGAIAAGLIYYLLVYRSRFGFDLRASGINPFAARSSGVNPKAMVVKTMLISGAFAGLIGIGPLLGDIQYHHYSDTFPTGLAFTGIALALIGRNHPVGVGLAALLWSFLEVSTQVLSLNNIPQEISQILQGAMVVGVVVSYEVVRRRQLVAVAKGASQRASAPAAVVPA